MLLDNQLPQNTVAKSNKYLLESVGPFVNLGGLAGLGWPHPNAQELAG